MAEEAVLSGLSALVTGGARGLGKAMADALLAAGANVVVADVHPDASATEHDQLVSVRADISKRDGAEQAVQTCIDRFGDIDVVVNNAGVLMTEVKKRTGIEGKINFWDVDDDTVRFFLGVHAVGSFMVAKAAVPYMLAKRHGKIIVISTSFSTMLSGGRTPYGPAKAAMEGFASVMSHDLDGTGVTVNVLIPGHPEHPPADDAARGPDGRRLTPRIPPEVMGPPAVWLASRASDGVTGRRFIALRWDSALAPAEAAEVSGAPIAWASLDH